METPGIDIVGPLPREISTPTTLVGFVSTHAKDPAAAKALLAYLSSPAAAAVYLCVIRQTNLYTNSVHSTYEAIMTTLPAKPL